MRLQKVKTLISDGKTQQAIDLLQEILKDKDVPLLNQTLLLEGQLKELQRKMQLGLQDASSELNRINFTLLSVCDDASNLENIGEDAQEKPFTDDDKPSGLLGNPLAIFGIIAAVGIAVVLGIYLLLRKPNPVATPQTLPATNIVTPSVKEPELIWQATPTAATVTERYYGNVKIDVLSIKTTDKDANHKILSLDFKFNCMKSSSGVCILNYLEFRLISPNGNKDAPTDVVYFANNPKDGTSANNTISFLVPKDLKQADMQVYYRDKMDKTLATIKLSTTN